MNENINKKNTDIQKNKDTIPEIYKPSIENYICDEFSICREERQYAVFLYNILSKYSCIKDWKDQYITNTIKDIFKSCHIPENAVIGHVFYEAAFMRDFFERNRRIALSRKDELEKKLLQATFSQADSKTEPDNNKSLNNKSFNAKLIQYVYTQKYKENNKDTENKFENLLINGKKLTNNEDKNIVEYTGKEQNLGHNTIEFEKLLVNGKELTDSEKD